MQPRLRNEALDTTRGVLVILMVIYHVMSIASLADAAQFRYIRFISGSFIFISGYVLARFASQASMKSFWRGLKLLALFTFLNLTIQATGVGNASKAQIGLSGYAAGLVDIYLRGDSRVVSFLILLPIAYLMMMSPLFVAAAKRTPTGLIALGMAVVLGLAALPGFARESAILELAWVGIFGLLLGSLPFMPRVEAALGDIAFPVTLGLLALSIGLAGNIGYSVFAYILGICAVLAGFYAVARRIPADSRAHAWLMLLGRYSLFAYIAQIVLIQMAFRALGGVRREPGIAQATMILAMAIFTLAACLAVDYWRNRYPRIDRLYRAIFA